MREHFDAYHKWLGIPPHEQPPHYYRLLAVQLFESDSDVIESAADQRMAHVRSLQTSRHAAESQRILNELSAARVCLLSPEKKRQYDLKLRQYLNSGPLQPTETQSPSPQVSPVVPPKPIAGVPYRSGGDHVGRYVNPLILSAAVVTLLALVSVGLFLGRRQKRQTSDTIALNDETTPALPGNIPEVPEARTDNRDVSKQTAELEATTKMSREAIVESSGLHDAAEPAALPDEGAVVPKALPPSFPVPVQQPAPKAPFVPYSVLQEPEIVADGLMKPTPSGMSDTSLPPRTGEETSDPDAFSPITLPSGTTLSYVYICVPEDWPDGKIPEESGVRTLQFANGETSSLHAFLNARLHGPSLVLNEDASMRWAADYLEGARHGPLRCWGQDSQMTLFAEFVRGRKLGLVCLFRDRKPWLVQEWGNNAEKIGEYLVKWNAGTPYVLGTDALSDSSDKSDLSAALDRLAGIEEELTQEETVIKRDLAEWFRKMDRQIKQERVAASNLRKRGAILGAISNRQAAERAAFGQAWRQAMRRHGL